MQNDNTKSKIKKIFLIFKNILKKIISQKFFLVYHWFLAQLASLIYGFPSERMIIVGVTGTAGKSTVANLITKVLERNGTKVGLATTFNFKIGEKEWENKTKMTMLGRFSLQKLLKQMFKAGCRYAVIETSSQGIEQYRHLGINYDIGVFTNLSPEHIESHGSFDKYRQAKQKFFQHLITSKKKTIDNKLINKAGIINLDDENSEYFLKFKTDEQYGYTLVNSEFKSDCRLIKFQTTKAENIVINFSGLEFSVNNTNFKLNLLGKFNIYNALAAICVGLSQGVSLEACQKALAGIKQIPGRMEVLAKEPFTVLVDYAHTPDSLEKVYQTIKPLIQGKMICVFGSAGGGRDKWKRPLIGEIAEKYGDEIIITNEDPYDENPEEIINQISQGIKNKRFNKIFSREEAIKKSLSLAQKGDAVVITGKGCEPWIMGEKGEKTAWDDRVTVKKFLN
jgi:UDP-N-acetylmuramoyl-L-alanyl-D-glutamate--2,6-diaminopimelate ligase